jgi:hypothetical protein
MAAGPDRGARTAQPGDVRTSSNPPWLVAAGAAVALTGQAPRAQDRQKSVLSLYSVQKDSPMATEFDPTLERVLHDRVPGGVDYYAEFMDLARFSEPSYQEAERTFLLSKFKGRKFDVITPRSARHRFSEAESTFWRCARRVHERRPGSTAQPPGSSGRLRFKDVIDTALAHSRAPGA